MAANGGNYRKKWEISKKNINFATEYCLMGFVAEDAGGLINGDIIGDSDVNF